MGLRVISLAVAGVAALILAGVLTGPAAAQWRYYDGYRSYPPDYSPYPQFPWDDDRADQPRPQPPGNNGDAAPEPDAAPYGAPNSGEPGGVQQGYPPPESIVPGTPLSGGVPDDTQAAASPRTAQVVANPTSEPAGTIVIDTKTRHLFYVQPNGSAIEYGIGVGRQGFAWKGVAYIGRKSEWPRWIPPKEMLARRPDLPSEMSGGLANPLGARALYLFQGNKDTLFRIHGTNEPDSIGKAVSSGCIRMMNADVMDLYSRVAVGTRVVVL
jgi:lipoprotein-anchoring transpeptidase ErfK/SrfK